jgi:hypothetical protein
MDRQNVLVLVSGNRTFSTGGKFDSAGVCPEHGSSLNAGILSVSVAGVQHRIQLKLWEVLLQGV